MLCLIARFARWIERRRSPEPRPGSDDQWRNWIGPDGHPRPLNDQERADRAEREGRT